MTFPNDDSYWSDTESFLRKHITDGDMIMAPTEFSEKFGGKVLNYHYLSLDNCQWVVFHKDSIKHLNHNFLETVFSTYNPVFANEVFVIFFNQRHLPSLTTNSTHMVSFWRETKQTGLRAGLRQLLNKGVRFLGNEFGNTVNPIKYSSTKRADIFDKRASNQSNREMVYLGDHQALTRTIFGQKILVDTRDLSLAPHLLLDGYWESWVTNVFLNLLESGMTVVEVGANVGYYTLLSASKVGITGKVFSFEPNPEIFEILSRNVEINGFADRTVLINKAVTDTTGNTEFYLYNHHMGSNTIFRPYDDVLEREREGYKTIEVQTITLDEYFSKDTHVDLMKVDAEGSEAFIFEGMHRLIANNPHIKIICEFSPSQIIRTGKTPTEFLKSIFEHGFNCQKINTDSSLIDLFSDDLSGIEHCDLLISKN